MQAFMVATGGFEIDAGLIGKLEEISIEAGKAILSVQSQGFEVQTKRDSSPVTLADRSAESIIVKALSSLWPDIPIVAEEQVSEGIVPQTAGKSFFLVDALDGTKEFVNGQTAYTVNIGLIENGVPVVGVVFVPAQRRLFTGIPGSAMAAETDGAFNIIERREIQCKYSDTHQRIVASRSHSSRQTDDYIRAHENCQSISVGSSLKFCLLAEGHADLYPRFSPTMEWDTAAGDAILRAAGGLTVTTEGEPLSYGKRGRAEFPDFQNPDFIAKATCRADAG